jgi:membrane-associated protein
MFQQIYTEIIVPTLWQIGIFIAIFFESFPFIGALIPGGAILIFLAGLFSKLGYLNPWITFIICFIASFSSDMFGYYLGKNHSEYIKKYSKYILIKKEFIDSISRVIKRKRKRYLFFGKFNPATRAIVPFLIGMQHIGYRRYIKISFINTLIWAGFFFFIGFFLGKGIERIKYLGGILVTISFILFIIIYITYLVYKKIEEKNGTNKQIKS